MPVLILAFLVALVAPVAVGAVAHRRAWSVRGGPQAWGAAAAARFGPLVGSALVLVGGLLLTTVVSLGLGFLAKSIERPVDEPVLRWVLPRVSGNAFTRAQEKLTLLGNNPITQLVALISVIILIFAYRRRWWLPVVGVGVAVVAEKYLQKLLAKAVDRGHPPTTLGTFPSGGVGRILAVYGAIMILVILLQPNLSRAWRAGLWTGVVTGACVEAFTRVYLSKHWLTDAAFGLPFGALLLLTNVAAICALAGRRFDAAAAAPPVPAQGRGTQVPQAPRS